MSSGSGSVETRILEMQLDNKDFENGIRNTIKSLEDLETKLDLKDAEGGFEKVGRAANTVQFSSMEKSLDTITDKFSLLGNIGLQVVERISTKIVNLGETIIKAATIDPLNDGWKEFELKATSIQTILGGIRQTYTDSFGVFHESEAIEATSAALDELNEYADKTIYIFSQMTENVGKFTNQGISLEDSVNSIKGIANWAAAVGADATQMSRAMYNISQSLGSGSMQLIDWRSIRFANMATPEVKKLFAEVAKKMGTVAEDGTVKFGKKIFDIQQDFEGSLKSGWLTNDVMSEAFSIYAKAFTEDELIEKYGEDLGKEFYAMGEYAEEAATKVKTFSQLISVVKEGLGSGWAQTFEKLFGGFERQKEFFSYINDTLGSIINYHTDVRNDWVDNFADVGGVEAMLSSVEAFVSLFYDLDVIISQVIGNITNPFQADNVTSRQAAELFGIDKETLTEMRSSWLSVRDIFGMVYGVITEFQKWLNTSHEGTHRTPLANLIDIFSALSTPVMVVFDIIKELFGFAFNIALTLEPVVSSLLDLFGQVGETIYNVYLSLVGNKTIHKFFENISNVVMPLIHGISRLASGFIDLIKTLLGLDDTSDSLKNVNGAVKVFTDLLTGGVVKEIFDFLSTITTGFAVGAEMTVEFFKNIGKGFKGLKKAVYKEGMTPIEKFKTTLSTFFEAGFGSETAENVLKWFEESVEPTLGPIIEWFDTALNDINKFFVDIGDSLSKGFEDIKTAFSAFSNTPWDNSLSSFDNFKLRLGNLLESLFGKDTKDKIVNAYNTYIEPAIDFVAGAIDAAFTGTVKTINGLIGGFSADYSGATDLFSFIDTFVHGYIQGFNGDDKKSAEESIKQYDEFSKNTRKFFQPFTDALGDIQKNVIDPIQKSFNESITGIKEFLFGKQGKYIDTDEETGEMIFEHIDGLFDKIDRLFKGESFDETFPDIYAWYEKNVKPYIDSIKEALKWVEESILTPIEEFLFGKEGEYVDTDEETGEMIFVGQIDGLFDKINKLIAGQDFKDVFPDIYAWYEKNIKPIIDSFTESFTWVEESILTPINEFFNGKQGKYIDTDEETGEMIFEHVDGLFDKIRRLLQKEEFKDVFPDIYAWYDKSIKPQVDNLIIAFNWVSEQIITPINEFFNGKQGKYIDTDEETGEMIFEHVNGLFDKIHNLFNGGNFAQEFPELYGLWDPIADFLFGEETVDDKGQTVRNGGIWFKDVKPFLDSIWSWLSTTGLEMINYLSSHSMAEMWEDIQTLLFGELGEGKNGEQKRTGGVLTPLLDALQPIINFFTEIKEKLSTLVGNIDFNAVFGSIRRFFFGYDKVVDDAQTSSMAHSKKKNSEMFEFEHVEGVFERLGNFLDRVLTFFESDEWKAIEGAISSFYHNTIEPILTFGWGVGSNLFGAIGNLFTNWDPEKGFLENIQAAFGDLTTFVTTEGPALLDKLIPGASQWLQNFNLGDGLGGLFSNFQGTFFGNGQESLVNIVQEGTEETKTGQQAVTDTVSKYTENNKSWFDRILDLFIGSAKADEAEFADQVNGSTGIVVGSGATDAIAKGAEESKKRAEAAQSSLKSLGIAVLAFFGLSKASELAIALTGNQKKSFLESIGDIFMGISSIFQQIAWILGVVLAATVVNPDAIPKAVQFIKDILWSIVQFVGTIGGIMKLEDVVVDFGGKALNKYWIKDGSGFDSTGVAQNVSLIGTGLLSIFEAFNALFEALLKFLIFDAVLTKTEEVDGVVKETHTLKDRLGDMIGLLDVLLRDAVIATVAAAAAKFVDQIAANKTTMNNAASGATGDQIAHSQDSIIGIMTGMATFMKGLADVIQTLVITAGIAGMINAMGGDVRESITIISEAINALSLLLGVVEGSGIIMAILGKAGIFALKPMAIGAGITAALVAVIGGVIGALAQMVIDITANGLNKLSAPIFNFGINLSTAMNALGSIDEVKMNNAETALKKLPEILKYLYLESYISSKNLSKAKENAITFQTLASSLKNGFDALSDIAMIEFKDGEGKDIDIGDKISGMFDELKEATETEYNPTQLLSISSTTDTALLSLNNAIEKMNPILEFMSYEEGDDPFEKLRAFFTGLSSISSLASGITWGSFSTNATLAGQGLSTFAYALSQMGYVDENGLVGGVDTALVKAWFNTIIEALPDSEEVLAKLKAFNDAGGGNLITFANSLEILAGAIGLYRDVVNSLDDDKFKSMQETIGSIDELGKKSDMDFDLSKQADDGSNTVTRLYLFAMNLMTLVEGLTRLNNLYNQVGAKSNIEQATSLFSTLDSIGKGAENGDSTYNLAEFASNLTSLSYGLTALVDAVSQEGFTVEKFEALKSFIREISLIGLIMSGVQSAYREFNEKTAPGFSVPMMSFKVELDAGDDSAYTFIKNLGAYLNTLGPGIESVLQGIQDDKGYYYDLDKLEAVVKFVEKLGIIQRDILSGINKDGFRLHDLAFDLGKGDDVSLASALNSMYKSMIGDNDEYYDVSKLDAVGEFVKKLANAQDRLDGIKLETFRLHDLAWDIERGENGVSLTSALSTLLGSFKDDTYNQTSADRAFASIRIITNIVTAMTDLADVSTTYKSTNKSGIVGLFSAVSAGIVGIHNRIKELDVDEISSYIAKLSELSSALTMNNTTATIASMISETAQAVHDHPEIQLRVVPVFTDSAGNLVDMDFESIKMDIKLVPDPDSVMNVKIADNQINQLVEANREVRDRIDTISAAISQIDIVINNPYGPNYSYNFGSNASRAESRSVNGLSRLVYEPQ